MLDNNFKINLEMLSDWQVGTGAGIPGGIDELISKDADGFLQVPAKTLVGIWRDALERLTLGLDNGNEKGNWSKWVEVIFGNQPNVDKIPHYKPVPAILSLQPARISENLRAKIGNDKRLKQALTFTKVGVKIDEASGTSETEALRFEEMGRIGTVLEAEVELEKTNEIISALLILSAKLVERIGGKRRRGAGKCSLTIDGITDEDITKAVTIIKDNKPTTDKKIKVEQIEFTQNPSDWQTCEYTLTLETPVSIVTAVLGNVSETLDFIPGTYLINHFVKYFGQAIFEAIQTNNFQISPATISIDGNRSFPVPKVFAQERMNKDNVYNRLLENPPKDKQAKPIREGYISDINSSTVSHATTPQTILMHNAVDDDFQRPTTDVVGVYSREAIKAGTILKGEIRYKDLQLDFSKIKNKVRIGTSKKDGGLATIEVKKIESKKEDENTENKREVGEKLIVYLASDVMLRNANLRQTNLFEDLAEVIGLKGETPTFQQIQVRRIESWQTGWGFPRPTLTLMQAGSVVVFETSKTVDIAKIEKEGIGERRGEGYGQIIFNPQVLSKKGVLETNESKDLKLVWKKADATKAENPIGNGVIAEKEFAKIIEETAWREEIKLAVSKIAADEKLRKDIFGFEIERKGDSKKSIPPMSQIGGLRSTIGRLKKVEKDNYSGSTVTNWLKQLSETSNRLKKWGDNETSAKITLKKIKDLVQSKTLVWDKLESTDEKQNAYFTKTKLLVSDENNLKDELWAEAVKSLFYACQHAHKRDTEDK